jgi:ABC-type amino acid transport substrate-binding protein
MLKHQSQLKQAFDLALNHLIDTGLLADIWRRHLEGIAYPSHGLNT